MTFDDAFRALLKDALRDVLHELLSGDDSSEFVDQHSSPLGNRRHVKAIREGELPGRQLGRRWVARRADVDAYVADVPKPKRAPKTADELAAKLGLPLRRAS